MLKKIGHIVSDEKFIDAAYLSFASTALPVEHTYYCLTDRKEVKYIKTAKVEIVSFKYANSKEFAMLLSSYDLLIFHNLYEKEKRKIVLNVDANVKIWWIGWGVDYYHFIKGSYSNLFKPETLRFIKHQYRYGQLVHQLYKTLKNSFLFSRTYRHNYLAKIDYFSPVISDIEFDLVAGNNLNFKAKKIDWNYGVLLNKDLSKTKPVSYDVIVGNSAATTNNHADVLKLLSFILDSRNIIVPLSYGGNDAYKSFVMENASKYVKTKFTPLIDYMSLTDFNNIIQNAGFAIFNSIRQQAYGNINFLLSRGVKVFLDARNPIYLYLTQHGVKVFTIDEIDAVSINTPLSDIEAKHNFNIIHQLIGDKRIREKTVQALIEILKGEAT